MDSKELKIILEKLKKLKYIEGSDDWQHHTKLILDIQNEELDELKQKLRSFKKDNFDTHDAYIEFVNEILLTPPFSRFFHS